MSGEQQRILILMSNTGGGHRASAEALRSGFDERYGDGFRVDIVDLLIDYLPWPLNRLPPLYPWMANRTPWLWGLVFESGNFPQSVRAVNNTLARYAAPRVSEAFTTYTPDLVVSVHPLVHEHAFRALKRLHREVPVATVVTDLASTHPLWFNPSVRKCFVASEEAYAHGLRMKLHREQLQLSGLPIRPDFAQPPPAKATVRQMLGLNMELPTVLLVGGGDGVGPVAAIARAVARRLASGDQPLAQLVVICGRNRRLQERLAAHDWPIPTVIRGFVQDMPLWMAACDCIITKAGPGTIAEALVCGLPIILSGFIPGQEEGNVPFVLENKVGAFSREPAQIAQIVWRWFGPDHVERMAMAERAHSLGRPRATFVIVDALAAILERERQPS